MVCRKSLSRWASIWHQAPESCLNPRNENGPIPFTSVALLGLAHVRLHLDTGPFRQLDSKDPPQIATALSHIPPLARCSNAIPALLFSVHALSIPVGLGISYVTQSQGLFWSCQHCICSLECAIFLSKWLYAISLTQSSCSLNGKPLVFYDGNDILIYTISL